MIKKINNIANFLFENKKAIYCILFLGILFQIVVFYLFFPPNLRFKIYDDAVYYIGALENYLNEGTYHIGAEYSERMPGFLPVYLPLRLLFNQQHSLEILTFFQIVLYVFSAYFFVKIISEYYRLSSIISLFFLLLLIFSDYVTVWGHDYHTESLSVSSLFISTSYLIKALKTNFKKYFLISGIFMTWLIFLRPYMIVFYVFFIIYIFIEWKKKNHLKKFVLVFLFAIPFIFFDSIWTIRNYVNEKKIIPLQSSLYARYFPTNGYLKYREFIASFGGDAVEWNPNKEGMWFRTDSQLIKSNSKRPSDNIFPKFIFNKNFTIDSLKKMREYFWISRDTSNNINTRAKYDSIFATKASCFISELKRQHPFIYYIGSKFILTYKFVFQPFTYYLSLNSNSTKAHLIVKIFIYLINAFVIVLGFVSTIIFSFLFLFKKLRYTYTLLLFIPIYVLVLFPFYLRFIEYRFLVMAYPFFALLSLLLLKNTYNCLINVKKWFIAKHT